MSSEGLEPDESRLGTLFGTVPCTFIAMNGRGGAWTKIREDENLGGTTTAWSASVEGFLDYLTWKALMIGLVRGDGLTASLSARASIY